MYTLLSVLIVIVCFLIILVVLIQNPKGGGLGASFAGVSNNLMGVQRTTDFLEKATWGFAIALLVLSLATSFFLPGAGANEAQSTLDLDQPANFPTNTNPGTPIVPEQPANSTEPIQPE